MNDDTETMNPHIEMTAELVAAYVSRNSVPMGELPNLIRSIHASLSTLGTSAETEAPAEPLKPAVPVKKSVTDDYIISLEDGRKFKSLKRYLATSHGLTPDQYRAKWGLPKDYPMVAPAYAAKRSALAKTIGLGRKGAEETAPPFDEEPAAVAETAPPEEEAAKKPRRRGAKAT